MIAMIDPQAIHAGPVWSLLVIGCRQVTPTLRRLSLVGDEDECFAFRRGQWLILTLQTLRGPLRQPARIEAFVADELRLDLAVSVAEDAPAACWVESAAIGDRVIAEVIEV